MNTKDTKILVIGNIGTDLVATGIKALGEMDMEGGDNFSISPGGKARNVAEMIATYSSDINVAMIGKTSKDPGGLWKPPMDALEKVGVNTKYIKKLEFKETGKYPYIAFIIVERSGKNQIYFVPGISRDFSPSDLDDADTLFKSAQKSGGILALTNDAPLETVSHSLKKANELGIKVIYDPGGNTDEAKELLKTSDHDIFLIKPNEVEATVLTDIKVKDFNSARKAAQVFHDKGIENVLITHGSNGAYLFTKDSAGHIPVPEVPKTDTPNETGCGDQVMAVLCAELSNGISILDATTIALRAGSLQFYKQGIIPIKKSEI